MIEFVRKNLNSANYLEKGKSFVFGYLDTPYGCIICFARKKAKGWLIDFAFGSYDEALLLVEKLVRAGYTVKSFSFLPEDAREALFSRVITSLTLAVAGIVNVKKIAIEEML